MLREVAEQGRTSSLDEEIEINIDSRAGDTVLNIDRTLIRQIMAALVTNAVEASLPGERVTIAAQATGARCQLRVHNVSERRTHLWY